ncbi:hypothetical protein GX48_07651 [Paracoccidioides brasiliensis]|nr:hypothetical protein GX48_07651 [Paracoccidioides brasiliensis]
MHNEDNYHEFVTKFLHLADEVKIVKENYKTNFNDKLFFDLQRTVAVVNAIINTYAEFQKICVQTAHILQTINVTQKSKSLQENESNIFKQNTLQASDSQTSHSISVTKSSIIKKVLSTCPDIQCYYCKKKDHIVRNCLAKQKSQQMITELTENDTSKSSADSEKDISVTKSSIIKKVLSTCPDIQCYYCKKKDHIVRNCLAKQKSQQMITELTENDTSKSSADSEKE